MPSLLDHPVESLPGIGPTTGAQLRERGYENVGDLLWLLPRGYDDQRTPAPINTLRDGEYAVVEGIVTKARSFPRGGRVGFVANIEDDSASESDGSYRELKLIWFRGNPGLGRRFEEGARVRVAGRVQDYKGAASMAHGRNCARRPRVTRPACSSTLMCLEMAGSVNSNGSASSLTFAFPSASRARPKAWISCGSSGSVVRHAGTSPLIDTPSA